MAADRDYYRDRSPRGRKRSSSRDYSRSRSVSPSAYRPTKNSRSMVSRNRDSSSKNPFVNLNQVKINNFKNKKIVYLIYIYFIRMIHKLLEHFILAI